MKVNAFLKNYFDAHSTIKHNHGKKKLVASLYFASYFLVVPPLILVIGYGISKACNSSSFQKLKQKMSLAKKSPVTVKAQHQFGTNIQQTQKIYPVVTKHLKSGFFVDVLNQGGYSLNGKNVIIPPAGIPVEFARDNKSFDEHLDLMKKEYKINDQNKIKFQFKDLTTEEAINTGNTSKMALNFANEHHAGGGPGFHKEKDSHRFVYDALSARAQEESICQRSNLMASLTKLPHTLKSDPGSTHFVRSYYDNKFDSRKMAYISNNHLFGVQEDNKFYRSRYLEEPKAVTFITSAAKNHGNQEQIDCRKNSAVYKDARQRIETHLLAAALGASKMERDKPVELILGAFGCGAFAPQVNGDKYRKMIAEIYKELLPKFQGFFDDVTFAVPTFGNQDPSSREVANYRIFKSVLKF